VSRLVFEDGSELIRVDFTVDGLAIDDVKVHSERAKEPLAFLGRELIDESNPCERNA
jgi:hypothetical protein